MSEEIVTEHRTMVALTGNLSDFQLTNLKAWPFVLFDRVESVKVDYDFTKQNSTEEGVELHAGTVIYDLHFSTEPVLSQQDLSYKLNNLSLWVRYLFWSDTVIIIKKDGVEWQI
jgi:hypothetical protein